MLNWKQNGTTYAKLLLKLVKTNKMAVMCTQSPFRSVLHYNFRLPSAGFVGQNCCLCFCFCRTVWIFSFILSMSAGIVAVVSIWYNCSNIHENSWNRNISVANVHWQQAARLIFVNKFSNIFTSQKPPTSDYHEIQMMLCCCVTMTLTVHFPKMQKVVWTSSWSPSSAQLGLWCENVQQFLV